MGKKAVEINLALQGGGAHGALSWGVIDRLLEDDRVKIDSISATSAGAMNAIVLTYHLSKYGRNGAREALRKFWRMISDAGRYYSPIQLNPVEKLFNIPIENSAAYIFFDNLNNMFSPYELNPVNFNPLKRILNELIDFEELHHLDNPYLYLSATNVKTGKIKVFESQNMSADAVMASACLPFMFQAVEIDGEYYWDGGYMGNPAIFPLIYRSGCPDILIVHINPIYRDQLPRTAAEIKNRVNEISFNSSLMREMRAIAFISKLVDEDMIKNPKEAGIEKVYVHAISADNGMDEYSVASKLNTDWHFIEKLFNKGRDSCEAWLEQHFQDIGKKTTVDFEAYL